ncbi:MAG: GntR family transcriptional regulator [Anaerolineales bacterium]
MASPAQTNEIESIQKRPLKEDVFDALHEKIVSGKYKPGQWLRQDDIATSLGVSMTPVREALDLLVAAGLAERVPYRGVRVREMITKEVVEAYGLRMIIEAMIAQEAAKNITPDQLKLLEKMLAEMGKNQSLKDVSHIRQLSREFHSIIADSSNNELLVKVYAVVSNAFPDWLLYEAIFRKPELLKSSMDDMQREHTAILDALKKRDPEKAIQKSIEHLMESGKWLAEYLDVPAELIREKEEQASVLLKMKN